MSFQFNLLFLIAILITNSKAQNITYQAYTSHIRGISFTKDNKVITTSNFPMKVWDPFKNWTLTSNYFQNIPTSCCVYSSNEVNNNGLFAASVATLNIAYVWNLTDSNKLIKTFNEHIGRINALAMSSNNILATGSLDNTIKIWEMNSTNSIFTLTGHLSDLFSLAFLSDSILVSGSQDYSIKIWNLTNGSC